MFPVIGSMYLAAYNGNESFETGPNPVWTNASLACTRLLTMGGINVATCASLICELYIAAVFSTCVLVGTLGCLTAFLHFYLT